ncbi:MAG TPA: chemotaxis protein CheB, partial [Chitinophagaceae bacterium]|nr:chemotaxis protein CheB [Chitinophagaceae bacterium]
MAKNEVTAPDHLLVVGGSAGSLNILLQLLPVLPAGFPAAVLVVVHRPANADSVLAQLLQQHGRMIIKEAEDKEPLQRGHVYLAPPDYHLLVESDRSLALDYSEKIHYCRPAIDPTLETAADVYGPRLACLLLSGANEDGSDGLRAAARQGSRIWLQHPDSAEVNYMLVQALAAVRPHALLHPEEMGAALLGWANEK